jgi:hypothetical protein
MDNLLDLIGAYRKLVNDHATPDLEILPILMAAESVVYERMGGLTNPDIRSHLALMITAILSSGRRSIPLPFGTVTDPEPTVIVDDEQCQHVNLSASALIQGHVGFTPAYWIEGNNLNVAPRYGWTAGTHETVIVYTRSRRPLQLVGGLQVRVNAGLNVGLGKAALPFVADPVVALPASNWGCYEVTWPESGVTAQEREFVGSTLSVWDGDGTWRDDYEIKSHNVGTLSQIYVDIASKKRAERPVMTEGHVQEPDQFLATLSRGPDLPLGYWDYVLEAATGKSVKETTK